MISYQPTMDEMEISSSPESSWLSSGADAIREKSETQREAYKKAQAQLQKSQKDEKKAKTDNEDLFSILQRFIQNPFYEVLIPTVTELLQMSTPSRYIIALTALVYPESALYILTKQEKKDVIESLLSLHRYESKETFNENTLHPSIRSWMSTWVQFSWIYLAHEESSTILQKKLLHLMTEGKSKEIIKRSLNQFLLFFFQSRNIEISTKTIDAYAIFILRGYEELLDRSLQWVDPDILLSPTDESIKLFGL